MRVLVVTTWFPTSLSPASGIFVARDVGAIATRHDVVVLHLVAPGLADQSGATEGGVVVPPKDVPPEAAGAVVRQVVMDPRRPDHLLRARRAIRELERHTDVVHTMAISALLPLAARRPTVPWVHTEHWSGLGAPETLSAALRLARYAVRPLLSRPDVVAVVGEGLAQQVRRFRRGPVEVVPNIVTGPTELAPRREPHAALTDRGPLRLIGVGGLIPRKDPLTAVEATAALRERGVEAELTWVGSGPLADEIRARAGVLGVPLRLTGSIPPAAVAEEVSAADVFLLPTRAETFCLAAAEALAAGRPVVVGDAGGPREFVRAPSGMLVAPGAPARQWADAVEAVWSGARDLSAREVAGEVADRFGPARFAARIGPIYEGLPARRDTDPDGESVSRRRGSDLDLDPGRTPHLDGDVDPGRTVSPTPHPDVDIVIALHSSQRPVRRAVRSVLDGSTGVGVRVTVVAHHLPVKEALASLGPPLAADPRVRILELSDGIPSPSGPFNHGLDAATAPWVAIMGSDDTLAPGALAGWLAAAEGADPAAPVVVVPPLTLAGRLVPTPAVRPVPLAGRGAGLDLVRDRLSYRSAPLGLLSRGALALPGARLLPEARVGGDVPMVTALWSRAEVRYARDAPAYEIHEDGGDRVTYDPRPIAEQLASVDALWELPWVEALSPRQRRAIGTKVLRIHVFGAILTRDDPGWWTVTERAELARVTRRVLRAAPGCAAPLSLADHDLLAAIHDVAVPAARLIELAQARRRHGSLRTLLPGSWRHVLHREAPLRFMSASLLASRR